MSRKISEELKAEIINYYLSTPMSIKAVGNKFGICNPTVSKILKDVPKYTKAQIKNPNFNENFFEDINSEYKAYFLGLLISDGNVFKKENNSNRQASISITLDLKDEYMLLKFKEILGASTNVGYDGRGCGQIAVRSNTMAKDLEKYGVIPQKTAHTYLPNINSKYMPHLLRGILDGDGSIQAHKVGNRFLHDISFCGTHRLMQDISNISAKYLPLKVIPTVYDYKNRKLSEIKFKNYDDCILFGDWIYNNATIYLTRKYEKYLLLKNHYLDMKTPR